MRVLALLTASVAGSAVKPEDTFTSSGPTGRLPSASKPVKVRRMAGADAADTSGAVMVDAPRSMSLNSEDTTASTSGVADEVNLGVNAGFMKDSVGDDAPEGTALAPALSSVIKCAGMANGMPPAAP